MFGDCIDVYDLTRAVEDGATVRIFYESRLAKVNLSDADMAALDELADEITSEVDEAEATRAKSKWARLEAIVGAEERLDLIAADIVAHWERRREAMLGKAMIVTMSRRIAVRLYEKIVALRPDWHTDDPATGRIKVVMTGSATDPPAFQPHLYSKDVRREIKARAKDPDDPLELVIVRDMWLTGFDSPSLHTMYVDKTMAGAGLMQAIARVNRTFRDKPGGLIVDYIGVFANLQAALVEYSPSDRDQAGVPIEELVDAMLLKHDVVLGLFHGCDFDSSPTCPPAHGSPSTPKCSTSSWPTRTGRHATSTKSSPCQGYALAGAREEAAAIRNDVRLFTDARSDPEDHQPRIRPRRLRRSRGGHRDRAVGERSRHRRRSRRHLCLAGVDSPKSRSCPTNSSTRWHTATSPTSNSACCGGFSATESEPSRDPTWSSRASSPSNSKRPSTPTPTGR